MDIKESIESVRRQFRSDSDPFPSDKDSLENLKIKFLGRKGLIANLFSQIPEKDYGKAKSMSADLKRYSFLNNYFVYEKV